MRPGLCARHGLVFCSAIGLLAISACQTREPDPGPPPAGPAADRPSPAPSFEPLRDEIPPAELASVMAAHYKALGFMEQYKVCRGRRSPFREVHRQRARLDTRARIQKSLADRVIGTTSGVKAEQAKKAGR